ncbi:MAG TPA: bifunctional adenosylcobinamide kinase/adenosylcobinamide-phosphate guanylyltransferase [Thermoanaerobaculia bacterium]|nr:bifunctional adenosylcobinamide kinase/adenosylcobinamide-phosphate guanylyltransferase [Thermoanaerobaculia bacterium]
MTERLILITGGARSGKSTKALSLAAPYSENIFVATAQGLDDEMRARIDRHRVERGESWKTVEEPLDLARAMQVDPGAVAVVDCMTLWLSNAMTANIDIDRALDDFISAARRRRATVIVVTNEVGMGIVPMYESARRFSDLAGMTNQRMAAAADEVWLVVCGLGIQLK